MTGPVRVLVVDDEPIARERLVTLLGTRDDMDVVGEAGDGPAAVASIEDLAPDLVLLDVQMPEMNGFEVVDELGDARPTVVFVTAYDEFALRAFEIHALDYVLKPFDNERVHAALDRTVVHLRMKRDASLRERLVDLVQEVQRDRAAFRSTVRIRKQGVVVDVRLDSVDWIETAGNYVALHEGATEHLFRSTMNALESELDPERFLRIHRGLMVNTDRVRLVRYLNNGTYRFVLDSGQELVSGRAYKDAAGEFVTRRKGESS